jgi:hypothetical protein
VQLSAVVPSNSTATSHDSACTTISCKREQSTSTMKPHAAASGLCSGRELVLIDAFGCQCCLQRCTSHHGRRCSAGGLPHELVGRRWALNARSGMQDQETTSSSRVANSKLWQCYDPVPQATYSPLTAARTWSGFTFPETALQRAILRRCASLHRVEHRDAAAGAVWPSAARGTWPGGM